MKLLIVIHHRLELWTVPAWFCERLKGEFPQVELARRDSYEGVEEDLHEAEIVFTISLRPEQFAVCRKLRWLHSPSAAVHQFLFPELVSSDVVLTNSTEVHGPVVAEHVIALMFALAKKIPQAVLLQQKHGWGQAKIWNEGLHPQELAGATLGLIGLGSIGRRVAQMAGALGMKVIAVREHVDKGTPDGVSRVYSPAEMQEVLGQSDYVVLATPVLPATERLINRERLALMRTNAFLINVGRGALVDEAAVFEALRTRQIAGAALDVFEREPLPADSPLWDLDNLLITPHTAGLTDKLWDRHYLHFSENLRRYLGGRPLLHVVDKRRGY